MFTQTSPRGSGPINGHVLATSVLLLTLWSGVTRSAHAQCSVSNVTASTGSCGLVHLSWSGTGAVTYNIYRSVSSVSSTATSIMTSLLTNANDSTAVPFVTYYYWIQPVNPFCTFALYGGVQGMALAIPPAPTGVMATPGCQAINVSWQSAAPGASYEIWYSGQNFTQSASLAGTTSNLTYTHSNIVSYNGSPIYYWVKATNGCGTSGFSAIAQAVPANILQPPAGFGASPALPCGGLQLSWQPRAGAEGYEVRRNIVQSLTGATVIATNTGNANTSFLDSTAQADTAYYYFLFSTNGGCGAGLSSAITIGFYQGPPAAPTNVTATSGTDCNGITVNWAASPGAHTYTVYRAASNNVAAATAISSPFSAGYTVYTDTTVSVGGVWWYWVSAATPCGSSPLAGGVSGTRAAPLSMSIPGGPIEVYVGTPQFTLAVTGSGSVPMFQWEHGTSPINNATTSMLTINPTDVSVSGDYDCIVTNNCGSVTTNAISVVVRPRITGVAPASHSPLTPTSQPLLLTITGVGFTSTTTVYAGATALPTTLISSTILQADLAPSVPGAMELGGLAISAGASATSISNAASLALVWPGLTPNNRGVISQWPLGAGPGDWLTIGIEGCAPNQPFTFVVDFAPAPPSVLAVGPVGGFLLGANLPTSLPIVDGLGIYVPPSGVSFGYDALGTAPGGFIRVPHMYLRPNPALGVSVTLQAIYLDPSAPFGANVTWPRRFDGL